MMIVSAKISKKKVLTALLAAVAVIAVLVILVSNTDAGIPQQEKPVSQEAATNEERLAFLESFGWKVAETPTQTQEVRIPETFNEVFTRYNELQLAQGYDLSQYAGKSAKRYVYAIENHPNGPDYFATILVHKNKIIGGDITGTGDQGTIHGFSME